MGYQKVNDQEYDWLQTEIKKRISEKNTDIFCAINRIIPITKILSEKAEGTLFLSTHDFKKLYPALISQEFKNSKVNLIVSADVLLDEKKESPYTFFLEDRFIQLKQEKGPCLQALPFQKRVFVAAPSVQCDSFMIFNNKSYILKIENAEQPYFSCALNATYNQRQSFPCTFWCLGLNMRFLFSCPYPPFSEWPINYNRQFRYNNYPKYML